MYVIRYVTVSVSAHTLGRSHVTGNDAGVADVVTRRVRPAAARYARPEDNERVLFLISRWPKLATGGWRARPNTVEGEDVIGAPTLEFQTEAEKRISALQTYSLIGIYICSYEYNYECSRNTRVDPDENNTQDL